MNRKDDHIQLALAQPQGNNHFDLMRLPYASLPELGLDDIDFSSHLFQRSFTTPIFINAMTGGSEKAQHINERLAMLAREFDLPMASGSLSAALKDPSLIPTFSILRKTYPDGFLIANLGAHHPLDNALKAIDMIKANAFEYHLNAPQELAMPEGDRDFKGWMPHLRDAVKRLPLPLIVKEVGFGMSERTIRTLAAEGVSFINVGGRGGTNFSSIENQRASTPFLGLNEVGYSTVESLLYAQKVKGPTYFASGGVRSPLDVIKALVLGAKWVGLSAYFLRLVTSMNHEEAVKHVQAFITECKAIMVTMGVQSVQDLPKSPYHLEDQTLWIR